MRSLPSEQPPAAPQWHVGWPGEPSGWPRRPTKRHGTFGKPPKPAGPRRSLEMHQMSGSVDSTLRLLDLADEGRFPLMSHVWRLDNRDESRERRGPDDALHAGAPEWLRPSLWEWIQYEVT